MEARASERTRTCGLEPEPPSGAARGQDGWAAEPPSPRAVPSGRRGADASDGGAPRAVTSP